jgi:hypothetical protein
MTNDPQGDDPVRTLPLTLALALALALAGCGGKPGPTPGQVAQLKELHAAVVDRLRAAGLAFEVHPISETPSGWPAWWYITRDGRGRALEILFVETWASVEEARPFREKDPEKTSYLNFSFSGEGGPLVGQIRRVLGGP